MSQPVTPAPAPAGIKLCFTARTIVHEQDGTEEQVEIGELVKRGQVVASLVQNDPLALTSPAAKIRPAKPVILVAGPYTELSAVGDSLSATTAGYPRVVKERGADQETLTISIVPLICISDDRMEAGLTLYPPLPGSPLLSVDEMVDLLRREGISYGLNREILRDALERSRAEGKLMRGILVAMGLRPIAGVDARLRFDLEVGSIPGKILGDGRIDFRERRMFTGVRKGQRIAVKVPATKGTPGINVLGEPVAQKEGKDLPVRAGDNVVVDEASGEIRAARAGVLSVVQNTIKVTSKLTISGDIDLKTGNIDAQDAVEIGGTVQPGFQVKAHGDLLISGGIRSAIVSSRGNIVVREGAGGRQTTIHAAGDIDIAFVEQTGMTAGGAIVIRKNVYHSRIFAGGDIVCQKDSRIFGGILMAGGNLVVGGVGSSNAPPALIAAGTDGKRYLRHEALSQEILEKEEELEHCLQLHGHDSGLPFHLTMTEELEEMHLELERLNLASEPRVATSEDPAQKLRGRAITVQGLVYAGTRLRIGNVATVLEAPMVTCKFILSEDLQEIVAHPL